MSFEPKNLESLEADLIIGFQFNELTIRQAFIRKVYSILMMQMLITFGIAALFTFHDGIKLFVTENPVFILASACIGILMIIVLACCDGVRRKHPTNLILLLVFTIAESVLIGFICSYTNREHVFVGVGLTAVICFALTVFAFQSKYDFTGWGVYLYIFLVLLSFSTFLFIFVPRPTSQIDGFSSYKLLDMVYGALGAVLFSFYLVYDTQLMLGGKHEYTISAEEHVFAALTLYLDIINIFLHILRLLR